MDKEDLKYIEAGILGCSESELTEDLSQEVDSKVGYRVTLEDYKGNNYGGMFTAISREILYDDELYTNDYDLWAEINYQVDTLQQNHSIPLLDRGIRCNFAFSKEFMDDYKSTFDKLNKFLNKIKYKLKIDKIDLSNKTIVYADKDQVAYSLNEDLSQEEYTNNIKTLITKLKDYDIEASVDKELYNDYKLTIKDTNTGVTRKVKVSKTVKPTNEYCKYLKDYLGSIKEDLQEVDSDLTEGFWATKKSKLTGLDGKQYEKEYEEYKPEANSKYKRLCRKPINTLTEDEVIYIYAVRWTINMAQRIPYQTPEEAIEDILKRKPYMKNDLEECYEFVHQLSFPLTIYRGVRVGNFKYSELNTDTNNLIISGKQQSYSWTTDINIYKNPTSKFRNLTQIVACEIDSNIIDVANTIFNFIHYSAGGEYRVSYPENEITLKDNFKQSDLHNLRFINKDDINEVLEEDLYGQDKAQHDYGQAYSNLIDNDKTRLYRYREWANNSNNDYKEYIYNDLLNGKKEDALHYWYNHYKLFTGNYDLSYDDFLNTPITLYRATNVNEKEDATNPFFSYAQSKKLAQRFLDTTQGLYNNRTGEIEEIQIKPKDTLGMIPSDEDEIIVPNKAYQSRVNDMSSIVDNVIKYANENNVKLPYDRDYILTLFNKRDNENVKKLGAHLMNYIDKRKGNKIKESVDSKTFTFPNLRQSIDFFWKDRDAKIETVPIKKLVDDNNLLNDDDLQSYHQRQWDNKKASEFSIDKGRVNSMRISEVPYAVRKKDGRLELGDGRHRTRALYNDGYEYVTLPVITESKTTPRIRESLLQEGKQDIENFKKWIENNEDSNARLMSAGNKEAFINNWATEFKNIRQNLKSPYNDFYYWIKLNDWDAFTKFMQEQRNKKDAKQKEKEGARLIYSDKDWKVYEITTYEASVKYGANTKWCISGSKRWSNGENGKEYWDDYTSKGVKFYFFIGKDTKYAIALYPNGTDFEIFDAQDNSIAYIPNAPIIDEIKVDYYSHNEDRLLLNLVYTGQLPHVCSILSSYLCDSWVDIYDKNGFDDFLHQLGEYINPDYVKWLAVYNGLKDEEWYEEETGEEYEDEWMGDTTRYLQSDLGFLDGYTSLEDALTKDNPYFNYDDCEYFISDLFQGDIYCCKDWVAVWLHIDEYIGDETDLINFIKSDINYTWGYEDFEKVGLSKEYLQDVDESLDESLEDFDDEVGVVYHGGIEKSLHKDFRSILWFTEDYDYALDFGENIFICNLNLKNTFIVGNTDGYIRGLIPTQFSTDFTRLANNLKVTPKELLKCNPDAKNIYSIVRTKAFKELCIKNGYDSVETEEFGHVCFGVFNLDQVDIVDTDFEDESTVETLSPMDETLKPNLREELLLEKGTDYKKQAIKIISNSGLFDEETSTKIIDGLFRQDIHAFNHAPAWLEKYLKGIARMLVEYCDGDKSKVQQFLTECPSEFEYYLTWVKQNREKIGNSLDDEFVNNLTYEQVKEKNNKIRDEIDAKSKDELSKMKFSDSSNYTLVPIDSYKQMHKLYGGHWTGDGTDKEGEYAGNGGTSWCHTNSKYTYGSWVNNGKNKFFVLQRNDWKDIPFNEKTNKEMSGKDDYGNSLIAILVNRFGELSDATLRCNHVGISGSADNQYNSYSELSKVVGFNVEEEILKHGFEEVSVGGLFEVNGGVLTKSGDDIEAYHSIAKYTIPDGTRTIGDYAFSCCSSLRNITIPNSVTSIGAYAFSSCSSLRNIEIPNSVTSIGISAFFNCSSLTSITIPNSVTSIEDGTFSCCRSLTSIEMPNSVTSIEENAFSGCSSLRNITIPNSVTSIGYSAFYKCISLTSITIPDSVTSIGSYAFYGCSSLTSVTIPDSVTSIEENAFTECGPNLAVFTDNEYVKKYCDFKGIKYAPLSEYHKA